MKQKIMLSYVSQCMDYSGEKEQLQCQFQNVVCRKCLQVDLELYQPYKTKAAKEMQTGETKQMTRVKLVKTKSELPCVMWGKPCMN